MPDVTITISDEMLALLSAFKDLHNASTGDNLTTKQWVIRTLKQTILAPQLQGARENARVQAETQLRLDAATAEQAVIDAI